MLVSRTLRTLLTVLCVASVQLGPKFCYSNVNHRYKVDLRLPELCLHPAFHHQRNTPSETHTLSKINCVPADDLEEGARERAAST